MDSDGNKIITKIEFDYEKALSENKVSNDIYGVRKFLLSSKDNPEYNNYNIGFNEQLKNKFHNSNKHFIERMLIYSVTLFTGPSIIADVIEKNQELVNYYSHPSRSNMNEYIKGQSYYDNQKSNIEGKYIDGDASWVDSGANDIKKRESKLHSAANKISGAIKKFLSKQKKSTNLPHNKSKKESKAKG